MDVHATLAPDDEEVLEVEAFEDEDYDQGVDVEIACEVEVQVDDEVEVQVDDSPSDDDAVRMTWACCDHCKKWRRLGVGHVQVEGWWTCTMLGPNFDCSHPEELLSDEEEEEEEEFVMPVLDASAGTRQAGTWVQCDVCSKWRSLPLGASVLDGQHWECSMSPRGTHNRCDVPEEDLRDDEMEEADAAAATAEEAADAALAAVEAAQIDALAVRKEHVAARKQADAAGHAVRVAEDAARAARAKAEEAGVEEAEEREAALESEAREAARLAEAAAAAAAERAAVAAAWTAARDAAAAAAAAREASDVPTPSSETEGKSKQSGIAEALSTSSNPLSTGQLSSGQHSSCTLSENEAIELVQAAEAARRGGNVSRSVHGWSLSYVLRPPGSGSRGDIYMVDPSDGEVIRSIVGLKRKLGLAAPLAIPRAVDPVLAPSLGTAANRPLNDDPMTAPALATRRRKMLERPKAEAARLARCAVVNATSEVTSKREQAAALEQRAKALGLQEEGAVAKADQAAAAHLSMALPPTPTLSPTPILTQTPTAVLTPTPAPTSTPSPTPTLTLFPHARAHARAIRPSSLLSASLATLHLRSSPKSSQMRGQVWLPPRGQVRKLRSLPRTPPPAMQRSRGSKAGCTCALPRVVASASRMLRLFAATWRGHIGQPRIGRWSQRAAAAA